MPAAEAAPALQFESPYPGLRPFEPEEGILFHGREAHTQELLERLAAHRFLAVVGTSGSGKSSLVRAGLLPALYRGFLAGAGSRWRIAVMRPGTEPLDRLAEALADKVAPAAGAAALRKTLSLSSFGLVEAARLAKLEADESLLVVVDQFEELFRFHRDQRETDGGAEAQLFVASLLEAANAFRPPVYVVLTMRSDFLGDCSQFPGLAEALNQSQYLVPRLTREQRREAIEKPLALAGARMTPALVQRLLYELGEDPDQLPVLQHALNRTWRQWKDSGDREIEYTHYEKAGTLQGALRDHAEGLLEGLPEPVVGRIFRCLTTLTGGRAVRRPASFETLVAAAGGGNEDVVRGVVERYAAPKNSLLVLSPAGKLGPKTMVDIAHESLIRRWVRLGQWVEDEADCVRWYADAVEDVVRLRKGRGKTWRDPKLAHALGLLREVWNPAWAAWTVKDAGAAFGEVKAFLEQGAAEQAAEEAERDAGRQAQLNAERRAKEAAVARAESERREKEAADARADAEQREKEKAQALVAAERSRKKWLAVGFALAVLLAAVAGFAVLSYRRAEQNQADLISKTKSEEAAQQRVRDAEAQVKANQAERAEIEEKLKGASASERQKLQEDLKKLADKNAADEKTRQSAEARLKSETAALAELRQQASAKDKEYAAVVDRAAALDRDLKAAREEIEKLKAASNRPAPADPKAAEELRQARLRTATLEKELENLRAQRVAAPVSGEAVRVAGETRKHSDGLTYVWIPPGRFRMGCSPGDRDCDDDEKRVHDVEISTGFWLGETEVTQGAWQKVTGTSPSRFKGEQLPVERVSWTEASQYCAKVGGRLPTEAEWEYAARGGTTGARYGELDAIAWYDKNSGTSTHPVRGKQANRFGLYDMLGNVWEWTADWYGPYESNAVRDPKGPAKGEYRVARGGSWGNLPQVVRASYRVGIVVTFRYDDFGFRCAGEFR